MSIELSIYNYTYYIIIQKKSFFNTIQLLIFYHTKVLLSPILPQCKYDFSDSTHPKYRIFSTFCDKFCIIIYLTTAVYHSDDDCRSLVKRLLFFLFSYSFRVKISPPNERRIVIGLCVKIRTAFTQIYN